jgi:hypothetical protein
MKCSICGASVNNIPSYLEDVVDCQCKDCKDKIYNTNLTDEQIQEAKDKFLDPGKNTTEGITKSEPAAFVERRRVANHWINQRRKIDR